jgi:hypothetical protein
MEHPCQSGTESSAQVIKFVINTIIIAGRIDKELVDHVTLSKIFTGLYKGVTKIFRIESITKYTLTTINTRWETTWSVMVAKLTRLAHKIAIQLNLVAESCSICSSRFRRPVRKLLDTTSYTSLSCLCCVSFYERCISMDWRRIDSRIYGYNSIVYSPPFRYILSIANVNCTVYWNSLSFHETTFRIASLPLIRLREWPDVIKNFLLGVFRCSKANAASR